MNRNISVIRINIHGLSPLIKRKMIRLQKMFQISIIQSILKTKGHRERINMEIQKKIYRTNTNQKLCGLIALNYQTQLTVKQRCYEK